MNIYTTANPFVTHTWQLATGATTGLDLTGNIYQNTGDTVARINVINSPFHTNNIYGLIFTNADSIILAKKNGSSPWQIIKYFPGNVTIKDKLSITISPANANDAYMGSGNYYVYNSTTDVVDASYPFASGFHPDIHDLYIHPSQPDKLWAATDGGISVKNLAISGLLSGFTYKNNGIQSHLLWDLDDSELNKGYYISALQDNGIVFKGGILGETWGTTSGIGASGVGDGYNSNIYDADPTQAYVTGNSSKIKKFNYSNGTSAWQSSFVVTGNGSLDYFSDPQYPSEIVRVSDYNLGKSTNNGGTFSFLGASLVYRGGTLNYNNTPANNPCGNRIFRTAHPLNYRQGVPFNVYALSHRI
ncbi:MAG: hypothetical protein O9353_15125, partial [Bacteroidia bacterium]|nr:hypothetical protein [Bacteroidia bacterium]